MRQAVSSYDCRPVAALFAEARLLQEQGEEGAGRQQAVQQALILQGCTSLMTETIETSCNFIYVCLFEVIAARG